MLAFAFLVPLSLERSGTLQCRYFWRQNAPTSFAPPLVFPNRRFPPHYDKHASPTWISPYNVQFFCWVNLHIYNIPDLGERMGKAANLRVLALISEFYALFNFSIYFVAVLVPSMISSGDNSCRYASEAWPYSCRFLQGPCNWPQSRTSLTILWHVHRLSVLRQY